LARTSSAQHHLFYDIVWPKRVRKTGGSRELPQRVVARLVYRTGTLGENIALGNSREPPVENTSQPLLVIEQICRDVRQAPKRLPSRTVAL